MTIFPAPFVHVVAVDDDLVVLDLRTDAYFCLPDLARHLSFDGDGDGAWRASMPAVADGLIETGLFERVDARRSLRTVTPPPDRTSRQYEGSDPGLFARLKFFADLGREAGRIHGRSLKTLIARSPDLPLRTQALDEAMAMAVLFDRWMPWLPGQGQCLYRAYLLRACLATLGLGATWVFGVRTWPFSAHCWLQIGTTLLDDDPDRVALYTPILTVGA